MRVRLLALLLILCLVLFGSQNLMQDKLSQPQQNNEIFNTVTEQITEIEPVKIEQFRFNYNSKLPLELQKYLYDTCLRYDVSYEDALAIQLTENPKADIIVIHNNVNGSYDTGIFQINSIHIPYLKSIGITDLLNPYHNIEAGVLILSKLNKYEGETLYIAYNKGENGMKKLASSGIISIPYSQTVLKNLILIKEGQNV
jgi:regulator of RNase E activity RraB